MSTHEIAHVTVIIYRPDGQIVHVHESVTLTGGHVATTAEVEQAAFAHAARNGHEVAQLKAKHVEAAALKPFMHYQIDPVSHELVEKPLPSTRIRLSLDGDERAAGS